MRKNQASKIYKKYVVEILTYVTFECVKACDKHMYIHTAYTHKPLHGCNHVSLAIKG